MNQPARLSARKLIGPEPRSKPSLKLPPTMAHGIKPETAFQHRSRWDSDCHSRRGCSRLRPVFYLGDIMKAGLAPLLPLPAHRLARRVLRLEPHLRWPAAIGRVSSPMRQTCSNTVGPSPARCSLYRMARGLALPVWRAAACARSAASRAGRRRHARSGRRRTAPPHCHGVGSGTDGSPASRRRGNHRLAVDDDAWRRGWRPSTMAEKRSAQSWPLRVKQRTRAPSRRTISR